jgi:hypothetical protein
MKYILFTMLCGMFLAANAQVDDVYYKKSSEVKDFNGITAENGVIKWVHVYESGAAQLGQILKSGPFADIDGLTFCSIADYVMPYKKYGLSYMETPFYMQNGNWYAKVCIDIDGDRYRVTVTNIQCNANLAVSSYGGGLGVTASSNKDSYERLVLKKNGEFKEGQRKYVAAFGAALKDLFAPLPTSDNW